MSYLAMNNTELGLFDPNSMDTAGTELNQRYNAAYPFRTSASTSSSRRSAGHVPPGVS